MKIPQLHFHFRVGHDPYMDWAIMCGMSFILACFLALGGYLSFQSVGEALSAPTPVPPNAAAGFDQKALSNVINWLDARAAEKAAASAGYAGPSDPSS